MINFKRFVIAVSLTFALVGCSSNSDKPQIEESTNQDVLNSTASALMVKTSLMENKPDDTEATCPWGFCYRAEITITNQSETNVGTGWEMYFSSVHRILDTRSDLFTITHINGDLHKIQATEKFDGLRPGDSVTIEYDAEYWQIVDTDFMPRYYITAEGAQARVIENTVPVEIDGREDLSGYAKPIGDNPAEPNQWQRSSGDQSVIASAKTRYDRNQSIADLGIDTVSATIIPTPVNMSVAPGDVDISAGLNIIASDDSLAAPQLEALNARFSQLNVSMGTGLAVNVSVDSDNAAFADKQTKGAYTLSVTAEQISVIGADAEGAFYGVQSVASLITMGSTKLAKVTVEYDAPRFDYRGMHMDVARNFKSKAQVLKFLDQMAAYKMNKFHFHLADDEGWRLEIPGLPELTEVGSNRCHDPEETTCLLPQLGSGPDTSNNGSGYFTIADYAEILGYANARNIQVIPSMDMPGHSRAAVKSMEARYKKFMAAGDQESAEMYLLTDINDSSEYYSAQNYTDNTINPCMESSFLFMDKVISEIVKQHNDAGQPLTDYHIGADETAGAWVDSPVCNEMFADTENDINTAADLGGYFIKRISHILQTKGVSLAAWNDGLKHGEYIDPETLAGDASAYTWGTMFWGGINDIHGMANVGYDIVLAAPDVTYFDHPYEVDPKERGYYWGTRDTDTREVFGFMPENMPANAETMKNRDNGQFEVDSTTVTLEESKKFKGMQGHLWSETIRTDAQLEYMAFPRAIALAERAWSKADWELAYDAEKSYKTNEFGFEGSNHMGQRLEIRDAQWALFANTLGHKELAKLDAAGVLYRLPVPGAKVDEQGLLEANSTFPGLTIQYSVDGKNWLDYQVDDKPSVEAGTLVRTASTTGRTSRAVEVK